MKEFDESVPVREHTYVIQSFTFVFSEPQVLSMVCEHLVLPYLLIISVGPRYVEFNSTILVSHRPTIILERTY